MAWPPLTHQDVTDKVNETYKQLAHVFPGRRTAFVGDSITAGSGASNAAYGFPIQCSIIAGSVRCVVTVNAGVPGERSDQVLARVPAILANNVLDHMHLQVGTNDAGQAVTMATYQANVIAIANLARNAGVSLSISLIPPRGPGVTTAVDTLTRRYNLWLSLWAPSQGIELADDFTPIASLTTGYLLAAFDSGDGVHPSDAGHLAIAQAIAPHLVARQMTTPWPVTSVSPIGLISNPLMNGTTGWDDQGGSASISSAASVAPFAGDGLVVGNWLAWNVDNSAGGSTVNRAIAHLLDPTKYAAGDVCAVFALMAHNDPSNVSTIKLQITNNFVAFSIIQDTFKSVSNPGPILATFTIPGTVTNGLRLGFSVSAAPGVNLTGYLGGVQVYNLTQGGLVASV